MELKITRIETGPEGTFGVMSIDGKVFCCTLELPWKDNAVGVSCIPVGKYECGARNSAKFGLVPEVLGVKGRRDILIHPGNVLGDIQGCIMLGYRFGVWPQGGRALYDSRMAMEAFRAASHGAKKLTLEIVQV